MTKSSFAVLWVASMSIACGAKVRQQERKAPIEHVDIPSADDSFEDEELPAAPESPHTTEWCGGPLIAVQAPGVSDQDISSFVRDGAFTRQDEVHVIGVYEANEKQGDRGQVTVHVARAGHHALVVSAHEATNFVVEADVGATIDMILVEGYEAHTVTAPSGIRIVDRSGARNFDAACAYVWPSDDQGCDTPALVAAAKRETGHELTTFTGAYRASRFDIGDSPTEACVTSQNVRPEGTCANGEPISAYAVASGAEPILVVFGKYESSAGAAVVHVAKWQAPIVLALSSYEATTWTLDADRGANIQKIVLNGHGAQTINGAGSIPVETYAGDDWLGAYAYAWPTAEGGSDTKALVHALENVTHTQLGAFGGCYGANEFTLYGN